MDMLCKYKNIFGEPGKSVHSYRIFNIAIVDVVFTLIGAYLISNYFKISYILSCIILFSLGIIAHRLFCVKTTVDKALFPDG